MWLAVRRRDFADARRLGRKFGEDLRPLDDLGWPETIDHETVMLTMAPGELTRTLARLHKDAAGALGSSVSTPKEMRSSRSAISRPRRRLARSSSPAQATSAWRSRAR